MRGTGRPLTEAEKRELKEKQDALAAELREELPKIRERVEQNLEPVKEAVKPVGGPKKPVITEQYKLGRRYGDVMWELDEAFQQNRAREGADGERNVRVGDLGLRRKAKSRQELKDARWKKVKNGIIIGVVTILMIAMVAAAITTALR